MVYLHIGTRIKALLCPVMKEKKTQEIQALQNEFVEVLGGMINSRSEGS